MFVTVADCDDDADNDIKFNADEDESNCQDVSSIVAGVNDSASSPHVVIADQSDEEQEPSTKSNLPKSGLRIKLSLKPVRKSTREHKAPVSISDYQHSLSVSAKVM